MRYTHLVQELKSPSKIIAKVCTEQIPIIHIVKNVNGKVFRGWFTAEEAVCKVCGRTFKEH